MSLAKAGKTYDIENSHELAFRADRLVVEPECKDFKVLGLTIQKGTSLSTFQNGGLEAKMLFPDSQGIGCFFDVLPAKYKMIVRVQNTSKVDQPFKSTLYGTEFAKVIN